MLTGCLALLDRSTPAFCLPIPFSPLLHPFPLPSLVFVGFDAPERRIYVADAAGDVRVFNASTSVCVQAFSVGWAAGRAVVTPIDVAAEDEARRAAQQASGPSDDRVAAHRPEALGGGLSTVSVQAGDGLATASLESIGSQLTPSGVGSEGRLRDLAGVVDVGRGNLLVWSDGGTAVVVDATRTGAERVLFTLQGQGEGMALSAAAFAPRHAMFAGGGSMCRFQAWRTDSFSAHGVFSLDYDLTAATFAEAANVFVGADTACRLLFFSLPTFVCLAVIDFGLPHRVRALDYTPAASGILAAMHASQRTNGRVHVTTWSLPAIVRAWIRLNRDLLTTAEFASAVAGFARAADAGAFPAGFRRPCAETGSASDGLGGGRLSHLRLFHWKSGASGSSVRRGDLVTSMVVAKVGLPAVNRGMFDVDGGLGGEGESG